MIRYSNNQGFTLIELIVVLVIISILILFATPRFLNQISYANETQICTNILVLEGSIESFIRRNSIDTYNSLLSTKVDSEKLEDALHDMVGYDLDGLITDRKFLDEYYGEGKLNNYYIISDDLLEKIGNKSTLKGNYAVKKIGLEDEYNNIRIPVIYLNSDQKNIIKEVE